MNQLRQGFFFRKLPFIVCLWLAACPVHLNAQSPMAAGLRSTAIKGFTEPFRSIELAASEMGTLSSIDVAEGDQVQAGAILGRLNEDVLQASRLMASEAVASQGKLNAAMAELKIQQETLTKVQGLFERRHASKVELDRAQGQVDVSLARVEAVKDELRVKKFELQRIEAQIEQRRLRSPIDGIVTQIFKDEGEFVSYSDPVVFAVVQLDPLLVILSIPQDEARSLHKGMEVTLTIGSQREQAKAVVEFVSPVADAQSSTCRVKLKVPNADQQWQSGQPCFLDRNAFSSVQNTKQPHMMKPGSQPSTSRAHPANANRALATRQSKQKFSSQ